MGLDELAWLLVGSLWCDQSVHGRPCLRGTSLASLAGITRASGDLPLTLLSSFSMSADAIVPHVRQHEPSCRGPGLGAAHPHASLHCLYARGGCDQAADAGDMFRRCA